MRKYNVNRLLKKSICFVVFVARHCGVEKTTPHSSLLDASHLELFEQPVRLKFVAVGKNRG